MASSKIYDGNRDLLVLQNCYARVNCKIDDCLSCDREETGKVVWQVVCGEGENKAGCGEEIIFLHFCGSSFSNEFCFF